MVFLCIRNKLANKILIIMPCIEVSEKYQIPRNKFTKDIQAHYTIYYKTLPIKEDQNTWKQRLCLEVEAKILLDRSIDSVRSQ